MVIIKAIVNKLGTKGSLDNIGWQHGTIMEQEGIRLDYGAFRLAGKSCPEYSLK